MKRDAKHVACEGAEEILWAKYTARGAELAARAARIAELEALLVWSTKCGATYYADKPIGHVNFWFDERHRTQGELECDGTPASILAACERAMKESQRG